MSENALVLALMIVGVLLIAAVLMLLFQFRHRFGLQESSLIGEVSPVAKAARPVPDGRKRGVLIVAGRRFEFFYKPAEEDEVVRLMELIKHSLALLKETQYPDIIASRAKECETLMKRLPSHTSLDGIQVQEMLDTFRQYVSTL